MKIPFLKNFRQGFATNSSSSHSFVYMKNEQVDAHDPSVPVGGEFNWNDFRLDTIREKIFYYLASKIGGGWGEVNSDAEGDEEIHKEFPELSIDEIAAARNSSVDHDSYGLITPELARDPKVVVFGGNDNDGSSYERAHSVRSKEIDWSRTPLNYDDEENIPSDDQSAKAAIERQKKDRNY